MTKLDGVSQVHNDGAQVVEMALEIQNLRCGNRMSHATLRVPAGFDLDTFETLERQNQELRKCDRVERFDPVRALAVFARIREIVVIV